METYYLIDYENVREYGLEGIASLSDKDHVYLFYTTNANKISLDIIANIKAEFRAVKVAAGHQSLDMHLISFLGYIIGSSGEVNQYVIVSDDKGFDSTSQFWNESGLAKVTRRKKIALTPVSVMVKEQAKEPAKDQSKEQPKESRNNQQRSRNSRNSRGQSRDRQQKNPQEIVQETVSPVPEEPASEIQETNSLPETIETLEPVTEFVPEETVNEVADVSEVQTEAAEEPAVSAAEVSTPETPAPMSKIQQILLENKVDNGHAQFIAGIVASHTDRKTRRSDIYREIVRKFGQKRGLNYYGFIKKEI